jgi:hypothetical protein
MLEASTRIRVTAADSPTERSPVSEHRARTKVTTNEAPARGRAASQLEESPGGWGATTPLSVLVVVRFAVSTLPPDVWSITASDYNSRRVAGLTRGDGSTSTGRCVRRETGR